MCKHIKRIRRIEAIAMQAIRGATMESVTKQYEARHREHRAFKRTQYAKQHPQTPLSPGMILSHTQYPLRWQVLNTPKLSARWSLVILLNLHTNHIHTEEYHIVNKEIIAGSLQITAPTRQS